MAKQTSSATAVLLYRILLERDLPSSVGRFFYVYFENDVFELASNQ